MRYAAPTTLADATALLAAGGAAARLLAGGTDLLVQLRSGLTEPGLVVDVKRVPGLDAITAEEGGFRIGAAVPSARMAEHSGLRSLWPGVVEAMELVGSTQIQARATLAGNLCNASPAADSVPALIAAGATVRVCSAQGTRDCPVAGFIVAPGQNALAAGELVESIFLPGRPRHAADAYLRFIPRTEMDIAVVGAGVYLELDPEGTCRTARVALGAVAATPILVPEAAAALVGTAVDAGALARAGEAAEAAASPIDDKRGTVAFRRRVSGVLTRRAAGIARDRAGGSA